jgi:hypothetical protein
LPLASAGNRGAGSEVTVNRGGLHERRYPHADVRCRAARADSSDGARTDGRGQGPAASPTCPTFDARNFQHSTTIDNPYFPLTPGDLYTYEGNIKKQPEVDYVYVTHNTPTKGGVKTIEVRDTVYVSGVLAEDTLDWYAQDEQGNVWYMGEFTTEYPSGDHAGSWTAGVDGAQPGFIMEAAPRVGDAYCQENAPGVAQDAAQVISTTASRPVPYDEYTGNVLQTKDYSLIEPHSEYKFYAPGVGMVEAIALNGGNADLQLTDIQHNQ